MRIKLGNGCKVLFIMPVMQLYIIQIIHIHREMITGSYEMFLSKRWETIQTVGIYLAIANFLSHINLASHLYLF